MNMATVHTLLVKNQTQGSKLRCIQKGKCLYHYVIRDTSLFCIHSFHSLTQRKIQKTKAFLVIHAKTFATPNSFSSRRSAFFLLCDSASASLRWLYLDPFIRLNAMRVAAGETYSRPN